MPSIRPARTRDQSAAPPARHRLPVALPFDWAGLHAYLAARAIPGVEAAPPGLYARTIVHGGRTGTLTVFAPDGAGLPVTASLPDADAACADRVRRLFDLDADPAAIGRALSADPLMAGLVAARPGLRVPGAFDGFELAVRAILGQQVSVAAATRLAGRLAADFGTPVADEQGLGLDRVFPAPEALVEADVAKALNMPRARGAAIRALAAAVIAEPDLLAPGQGLAAAVARLTALPGIGPWTAQYVAMRALREPDALPTGDIGLLRALADETGLRPSAKALEARSAAWRPWRAYAVLHLWAHDAARVALP
ncbi:DNA-3-methyladenine glycosylase family protein [Methylobacterium sp. A54F]